VPVLGTSLLLVAVSCASLQWVVPETNQAFRAAVAASYGGAVPTRGWAEQSLTTLASKATAGDAFANSAWNALNSRVWVIAVGPVLLWLGSMSRRVTRSIGWRVGGGLIAWAALAVSSGGAFAAAAAFTLWATQLGYSVEWVVDPRWFALGACALAALVLGAAAARNERRRMAAI
jgi:hypothetical protein